MAGGERDRQGPPVPAARRESGEAVQRGAGEATRLVPEAPGLRDVLEAAEL